MMDKEEKISFWIVVFICALGCSLVSCDKSDDSDLGCMQKVDSIYGRCFDGDCTFWMVTVGNGSRSEFTINRKTYDFYRETEYRNEDVCYDGEK